MRGVYEATASISSLSAGKTLMYISVPSTITVEILSIEITNTNNATNQQLEATFQRITTLGSPTATSITPTKTEQGDQASACTVAANVTSGEPTYTSGVEVGRKGFASLAGYQYAPVPEERPVLAPSSNWGLRMLTSSFTAMNTDVVIRYREIG